MKNRKMFRCSIVIVMLFISHQIARSQTDTEEMKKFEIGVHFVVLRQKSFQDDSQVFNVVFASGQRYSPPRDAFQTENGFGGRFSYNFNKNLAVEVESNFFPLDRLSRTGRESARIFPTNDFVRVFLEPQGRKLQVFAGPKVGYRGKKFGVFAKVRPGLFYVERLPVLVEVSTSPASILGSEKKTVFFSADVGGVVELYPSNRTVVRFDLGDTIIRYHAQAPRQFNPGFTRHTFQFSSGVGFRF